MTPYTYAEGYRRICGLQEEGKLHSEVRPQQCRSGVRNRVYMWLD